MIAKHEDSIGPLQGAKAAGVMGIGSESDTSAQTPEAYLTGRSTTGTPTPRRSTRRPRRAVKNDELNGGLKDGLVKLGPFSDDVPEDVRKQVEERPSRSSRVSSWFQGRSTTTRQGETGLGSEWVEPADVYENMTFFVDGIVGKIQE